MINKVRLFNKNRYLDKELFLACSGGLDSMVLFNLLYENNLKFSVLHVNYFLRGSESDNDELFIREYCNKKKIDLKVLKVSDEEKKFLLSGNLQEKARCIRYNWFNTFLSSKNARILVAHQSDDQLETFYLNLARKSGVNGLACMKERNNNVIRPLLKFSKNDLITYANKNNLEWRNDSSNFISKYNRNKLRNEILPDLLKNIPSLKESILNFILICQKTNDYNNKVVNKLILNILKKNFITIQDWKLLNSDQKLILIKRFDFSPKHLLEIEKLLVSIKGKKVISKSYEIVKEVTTLTFLKRNIENKNKELIVKQVYKLPKTFNKNTVYLDANKIVGELKYRKWKAGDKIFPIGINGGKLISNLIKDSKINYIEKNNIHIIYDNLNVYLCEGLAVSKFSLADSTSKKILKVYLK